MVSKSTLLKPKTIALWSGPRNVSTALMYYFAYRGDTRVWDEPLFGYFLKHTGVWRPSRDEALAIMETNPEKVLSEIEGAEGGPFKFLKNMANHLEGLDYAITHHFHNVILCRQPAAVLASYTKQIEKPTALDLGYQHQLKLLQYLTEQQMPYFILDSDDLRKNPAKELGELAGFLGMPFTESMLSWPAGPLPEDGIWAKYWYDNVHQSTGFAPYEDKAYDVPQPLLPLLEDSKKLFQQILKYKR